VEHAALRGTESWNRMLAGGPASGIDLPALAQSPEDMVDIQYVRRHRIAEREIGKKKGPASGGLRRAVRLRACPTEMLH
jgi:hypothetical protein